VESALRAAVKSAPISAGDLLALRTLQGGSAYLVASFHGDTDGLATIPVLAALVEEWQPGEMQSPRLIFGLDANTYEHGQSGKRQGVEGFAAAFRSHGLTSCWGSEPNPQHYTTFNAR
jgi:hypothetical protein